MSVARQRARAVPGPGDPIQLELGARHGQRRTDMRARRGSPSISDFHPVARRRPKRARDRTGAPARTNAGGETKIDLMRMPRDRHAGSVDISSALELAWNGSSTASMRATI